MKGISLPVNAVIVIALAVLVLVVISVMFSSSTGTSTRTISHADAWNRGCSDAKVRGCLLTDFGVPEGSAGLPVKSYDPDGDGADDNVFTACQNFFADSRTATQDIRKECRNKCCGA